MKEKLTVTKAVRHDGHREKAFPTGIQVTAHALWQIWPHITGQVDERRSTIRDFAENEQFSLVVENLKDRYPGFASAPYKDAYKTPMKLGTFGKNMPTYYDLRIMADYVGLPVGLFIFFTHLVSEEREANKEGKDQKMALKNLIDCIDRFSTKAKKMIDEFDFESGQAPAETHLFSVDYPELIDGETWLAKMDTLLQLVNATKFEKSKFIPESE